MIRIAFNYQLNISLQRKADYGFIQLRTHTTGLPDQWK